MKSTQTPILMRVVLAAGVALAAIPLSTLAADQAQDPAAFARGAKTWTENCDRCHNLRDPKDFGDQQWRVIMTHMRIRAGLTGAEARDILKFLQGSN